MKNKLFNTVFWIILAALFIVITLTFSIAKSNDKRRQEYEQNRLQTLTAIREAVKDVGAEGGEQHGDQDKKFECLISLFITWTNNGQQPISEEDAKNCAALDDTQAQSSGSQSSSPTAQPKPKAKPAAKPNNPPAPEPEDTCEVKLLGICLVQ